MQRLTLAIPVGAHEPGDRFHVYSNADRRGVAQASIDMSRSIASQPFLPLARSTSGHLDAGHLEEGHLGFPPGTPPDAQVTTPPLYFGTYRFAAVAVDSLGNVSAGTPEEFEAVVNSGPAAPVGFRQSGVTLDGRPVFSFAVPEQMQGGSV